MKKQDFQKWLGYTLERAINDVVKKKYNIRLRTKIKKGE